MEKEKVEIWQNIGKQFIKDGWTVFSGIAMAGSIFGVFWKIETNQGVWILFIVITFLIITFVRIVDKLILNNISKKILNVPAELEKLVKYLYNSKKYIDVVRLGTTISRFLWLSNYNTERINIGKMVEDSASKTRNIQEQVSALIDDIGWTYHVIGNTNKAKTNINAGIKKAVENKLYYFAAKGERHLAGIEAHDGNRNNILTHLNNSQNHTTNIQDETKKSEMKGSLLLAKAEYYFEEKNYTDAETNALQAQQVFGSDNDRLLKTHSLLGNIYFAQNTDESIQKAKDEFNSGYNNCKDQRRNEYARNAVGLAKIAMRDCNTTDASRYLQDAKIIFAKGKKQKELQEVNNLLTQINNGTT
jgi:tetratricopeptide (TPR) repeat protein